MINTAICTAIGNRSVIEFQYDGGSRKVEPHYHGETAAGNEVLRGYQTSGYSSSGNPVGWKLFSVSKISGMRETGDRFLSNRPGYNPDDKAMRYPHCHV